MTSSLKPFLKGIPSQKTYYNFGELGDHLGNVLATVLDRKTGVKIGEAPTMYDHWSADLASVADYYPGGMMMPGRNLEHDWSRMGYNGQAKDDEVYGKGNLNTAKFWEMDTRILRRWNVDPVDQISISNYAVFGNNSIYFDDPLGDDFKDKNGKNVKASEPIVATSDGSRITNTATERNWDYGTWNEETQDYDFHNYEKTDGLSAGQLLDLGRPDLWSLSSVRALGNTLRKAEAKANGEGSYLRNIIELEDDNNLYLRTIVAPAEDATRVRLVNDLDIIAFAPGGGAAGTLIKKAPPVKPSQIINGLEKMGKMKKSALEKMPRKVAKLLDIDYHKFSEMIHKAKKVEGRGGADNYSWDELMEMGKKLKSDK